MQTPHGVFVGMDSEKCAVLQPRLAQELTEPHYRLYLGILDLHKGQY